MESLRFIALPTPPLPPPSGHGPASPRCRTWSAGFPTDFARRLRRFLNTTTNTVAVRWVWPNEIGLLSSSAHTKVNVEFVLSEGFGPRWEGSLLCEVPLGQAPCGSAVYGRLDEMSPAPSPSPSQLPGPPAWTPPTWKTRKTRRTRSTTLPARDFALQLP